MDIKTYLAKMSKALTILTILTVLMGGIFMGISLWINSADLSAYPEPYFSFLTGTRTFFSNTSIVFLVTFIFSFWGYAKAVAKAQITNTEIGFKVSEWVKTLSTFMMGFLPTFMLFPAPYSYIGVGIVFLYRMFISVWKDVMGTQPTPSNTDTVIP